MICNETDSDIQAIFENAKVAFEIHLYSTDMEPYIAGALRVANVLTISLVAEVEGKALGHAAVSPVIMSDGRPEW